MEHDKIEKQPTLPVVDFSEKPYGYEDKSQHYSDPSAARWPSELPPDAYKPGVTRTDYIENVATREPTTNVEYMPYDEPEDREYEKVVPLNRRQKTMRHFKRFWICYVLAGVVALAAGLPIFFLVILPALAQKLVDSANLPIHAAFLMAPTPNTITTSLTASLKVPLGLKVKLAPTKLQLYNPKTKPFKPYITVLLPGQTLKGNTTISVKDQVVEIEDMDEFEEFLREAVYAEDFELFARGKTSASLGSIKVSVTLDKGVKMKGLNGLKGFEIIAAQALVTPDPDGSNFRGVANLPNPSIVAFELGDETLDLMIPGGPTVGQGTIKNASLVPGNNTVSFGGFLDYDVLFANLETILNAEADALSRGNLGLNAKGYSTNYKGTRIPYYEKIFLSRQADLNNMTLGTEVPITNFLVGSLGGILDDNSATLGDLVNLIRGGSPAAFLSLLTSGGLIGRR